MGINSYIDYIDDPNDTFDEYLEKARRYGFRCVFARPETYDHACAVLAGTGIIVAGAIDFPAGALTLFARFDGAQITRKSRELFCVFAVDSFSCAKICVLLKRPHSKEPGAAAFHSASSHP